MAGPVMGSNKSVTGSNKEPRPGAGAAKVLGRLAMPAATSRPL